MSQHNRLLIIGLDGATFDVLDSLRTTCEIPTLSWLLDQSARGVLDSTRPIATLPAWTTFLTTASPSYHGITDIFLRLPFHDAVEPASGLRRSAPTWLLELARSGARVGAFGFPGTYPAEEHPNLTQISGFDTPDAKASGRGVSPTRHQRTIDDLGGWHFSLLPEDRKEGLEPDRCAEVLVEDFRIKTRIVRELHQQECFDVLAWHIQPSDTIAHHAWASWDRMSPRARAYPATNAFEKVFEAIDASLGKLLSDVEPTHIMVVSDHGFGGAGDQAFYVNRWLATQGVLEFSKANGVTERLTKRVFGIAQNLKSRYPKLTKKIWSTLATHLPPSVFSGIRGQNKTHPSTQAFSDEFDYAPSIWISRRSHFSFGILSDEDADALQERLAERLRQLRHPAGHLLFDHVWLRPKDGPHRERLPDIVLEPAFIEGYRTSFLSSPGPGPCFRKLEPNELRAGRGFGMPGVHHADGVLMLHGEGWPQADLPKLHIADAGALVMGLFGLEVPAWSDWRPPEGIEL